MVQPFIFFLYPLSATRQAYPDHEWSILTSHASSGGRFRAANGPAVYPHSISATRKAYPEPEGSRRSSSVAIHRREGVFGPRVVPPFIFTRHPPPGRRIGGPRVVQSSIFARYPPPERPLRTLSGPGVHLYSPSTAVMASPDREPSSRLYSLAIRRQEGVSGPRMV